MGLNSRTLDLSGDSPEDKDNGGDSTGVHLQNLPSYAADWRIGVLRVWSGKTRRRLCNIGCFNSVQTVRDRPVGASKQRCGTIETTGEGSVCKSTRESLTPLFSVGYGRMLERTYADSNMPKGWNLMYDYRSRQAYAT